MQENICNQISSLKMGLWLSRLNRFRTNQNYRIDMYHKKFSSKIRDIGLSYALKILENQNKIELK